ncbi:MAG: ferrous iron transport protein A [Clostridia bacterium]|nr:ferrous iron transport protein A [Clostridia bacterium]
MYLIDAKINNKLNILKVEFSNNIILSRLYDLNVKQGSKITVIRESSKNACALILVEGRLVALSNEICATILVEKVGDNNE